MKLAIVAPLRVQFKTERYLFDLLQLTSTEEPMRHPELEKAIKAKTIELELAMEFGKPKEELLTLYKQLKELYFQKLNLEQAETEKDRNLIA